MTISLPSSSPDQAVWQAFDHAADSYDRASHLQHLSAEALYRLMQANFAQGGVQRWLDVGCGTGGMAKLLAAAGCSVIAVDQSPAMLAHVREMASIETLQADMRHLPLADGAVDGLVSHFALHWLEPQAVLPELCRVVKSGGTLWLALPVAGSLAAVIARYPELPVFDFAPAALWQQALAGLPVEIVSITSQRWSQTYPNLRELLHSLKLMGGNRLGRLQQPVSPAEFRTWLRDERPIALEYQVLYVQLRVR
jgi:ubiquinone/menaquinone biosynthesis C-methylase UbiE